MKALLVFVYIKTDLMLKVCSYPGQMILLIRMVYIPFFS